MTSVDYIALAETWRDRLVSLCQDLIRIPSPPGGESGLAQLVAEAMRSLGYDSVEFDSAGNVIGKMLGSRAGPSLMLNAHLDHVDAGDSSRWPYPPFAGVVADGSIWGRGASDIKGPLAVQILAPAVLRSAGVSLDGEVLTCGVVMEEVGGVGTQCLLERVRTDRAIVGEATSNRIARGHRGRFEYLVRVTGQAGHASAPSRSINPLYSLARFLTALDQVNVATDPFLGSSTVAPTLIGTDQKSANVIPGEARVTLDWRNVASESPEGVRVQLEALLRETIEPGAEGSVMLVEDEFTTYTGLDRRFPSVFPSFVLPQEHDLVRVSRQSLCDLYGRDVPIIKWDFATDGGHLMAAGIPTIGFAPGREDLVHTNQERIAIGDLVEGLAGYLALLVALTSES